MADDAPDDLFWVPINSSAIKEAAYDPYTLKLWIRFVKGNKTYCWIGVPKAKWELFKKAASKGTFYWQHIEGRYQLR